MSMVIRDIAQAQAELSTLVEAAGQARKPGSMKGQIWIAPDFDELPDDIAEAMGAKPPAP